MLGYRTSLGYAGSAQSDDCGTPCGPRRRRANFSWLRSGHAICQVVVRVGPVLDEELLDQRSVETAGGAMINVHHRKPKYRGTLARLDGRPDLMLTRVSASSATKPCSFFWTSPTSTKAKAAESIKQLRCPSQSNAGRPQVKFLGFIISGLNCAAIKKCMSRRAD